jgi:DNA-directed RNA polymerase alpha subunit
MEPTNLTFEQQLIHTLLKYLLQEQRVSDLTDLNVSKIRYFAKKLSEGTEPEVVSKLSSNTRLADLPLSVRLLNGLQYNGIHTVGELTNCTRTDLLKMRLVGAKSYREILEFLYENNLKLKS